MLYYSSVYSAVSTYASWCGVLAQFYGRCGGRKIGLSVCCAQGCWGPVNLSALFHSCQCSDLKRRWCRGDGGCQSSWMGLAQLLIGLLFQSRAPSVCSVYCFKKRRCWGFAAYSPRTSSTILIQIDWNLVSLSDMLFLIILTPISEVR